MTKLQSNTLYTFHLVSVAKPGVESEPSETILEWTDPVVPAYAEVN